MGQMVRVDMMWVKKEGTPQVLEERTFNNFNKIGIKW